MSRLKSSSRPVSNSLMRTQHVVWGEKTQTIPFWIPLSSTASLTSSVMSRTSRPCSVRTRCSIWKTVTSSASSGPRRCCFPGNRVPPRPARGQSRRARVHHAEVGAAAKGRPGSSTKSPCAASPLDCRRYPLAEIGRVRVQPARTRGPGARVADGVLGRLLRRSVDEKLEGPGSGRSEFHTAPHQALSRALGSFVGP